MATFRDQYNRVFEAHELLYAAQVHATRATNTELMPEEAIEKVQEARSALMKALDIMDRDRRKENVR